MTHYERLIGGERENNNHTRNNDKFSTVLSRCCWRSEHGFQNSGYSTMKCFKVCEQKWQTLVYNTLDFGLSAC